MTEQGMTQGRLLYGTDCHVLLKSGVFKSLMSKSCYLWNKSLHDLPKLSSEIRNAQLGNSQSCIVFSIHPVIVDTLGHIFDIYTLVSERHDNNDVVLGLRNIYELKVI